MGSVIYKGSHKDLAYSVYSVYLWGARDEYDGLWEHALSTNELEEAELTAFNLQRGGHKVKIEANND